MEWSIKLPKYYFGQDVVLNHLKDELKLANVTKVMLLYGKGSIKINFNLYDDILNICHDLHIDVIEHSGISANPRDTECDIAIKIAREKNVQLIIAAGGGSVIDASKVIAAVSQNHDYASCWEYVLNPITNNPPLPIFSIITLAATGSENNFGSVITNEKQKIKIGVKNEQCLPKVCFADPKYTLSVNKNQTFYGIFDIFSHLLEQYYCLDSFAWNDQYLLANMKTLLINADLLNNDLSNLNARANVLLTSSFSLNKLSFIGKEKANWEVHSLEHALSGLWDIPHGAGLAIITPWFITFMCQKHIWFATKIAYLGKTLWDLNTHEQTITFIVNKIKEWGLPLKISDFNNITQNDLNKENIDFLTNHYLKFSTIGNTQENREMCEYIWSKIII